MRIGIVTYWFNRGQAVVGRHLRSAFDELGHTTFVLARPTEGSFVRPGFVADGDRWGGAGVTRGSQFLIPAVEYERWVEANDLDAVFFDQNYQFDEIERLRHQGVRTFGKHVWEQFGPQHAAAAGRAFDVLFACNRCDTERYRGFGLTVHHVPWGCHPETIGLARPRLPVSDGPIRYFFPGGYLSFRKPVGATLDAFARVDDPSLRLEIKALGLSQWPQRLSARTRMQRLVRGARSAARRSARPSPGMVFHGVPEADEEGRFSRRTVTQLILSSCERDPRVRLLLGDLDADEYFDQMTASDVLLAPSRWEGLGLHLYEATALGIPTITCDAPPMNEVVRDGVNGVLVPVRVIGQTDSGIDAVEPDVEALAEAIRKLAEPDGRARLIEGTLARREELAWSHTVEAIDALLCHTFTMDKGRAGTADSG